MKTNTFQLVQHFLNLLVYQSIKFSLWMILLMGTKAFLNNFQIDFSLQYLICKTTTIWFSNFVCLEQWFQVFLYRFLETVWWPSFDIPLSILNKVLKQNIFFEWMISLNLYIFHNLFSYLNDVSWCKKNKKGEERTNQDYRSLISLHAIMN